MSTQFTEGERIIERCREIAACTEVEGEITRTFLADPMHRVHEIVGGWMRRAGIEVRMDAIGNIRGVLRASAADAQRIVFGSHLDTVVNAGAFDGVLGVVLALAVVERIHSEGTLPFSIEVIGFSEEEGVRFGKPFLGSLAVVGGIDGDTLVQTDSDGLSVAEVVQRFGLNPGEFATAALDPATFGYVEFHIEQGPLLDNERQPVAVVDAIAGQTRIQFTFAGHANHAGTTPMGPLRHDALAAAAEWISEVEAYGIRTPGLVATVGKLDIPASATNVVPGRCVASLDVRHACDPVRAMAVRHLIEFAQKAAQWRGVTVTYASQNDQPAVSMDTAITDLLDRAVTRITGKPARHMVSGAGHDAMILARKVPSAMLFLRSPGGISHHPEESVLAEDVEVALNTGVDLLRTLRDDTALLSQLVAGAKGRKYDGMHA